MVRRRISRLVACSLVRFGDMVPIKHPTGQRTGSVVNCWHGLDLTAQQLYGVSYDELDARDQSMLRHDLEVEYRTNTYDVARDVLVLSDTRYAAIKQTAGLLHPFVW